MANLKNNSLLKTDENTKIKGPNNILWKVLLKFTSKFTISNLKNAKKIFVKKYEKSFDTLSSQPASSLDN